MKIIFSRKAWDGTAGGRPNPIIGGQFVPLPIPKDRHRGGNLPLKDICSPLKPSGSLAVLVGTLAGTLAKDYHPDPWLYPEMLKKPAGLWLPAQGHTATSSAQRHLVKQDVEAEDLMLFYGWFREAAFVRGILTFQKGAPDLHVLFGYLQIGEVVEKKDFPALVRKVPGLDAHPHVRNTIGDDVLYVAKPRLDIPNVPSRIPGGGLFPKFHNRLVLSDLTGTSVRRSFWRLPGWAPGGVPKMSYLKNWVTDGADLTVQNRSRWQEFVLQPTPAILRWLASLF